MSIITCVMCVYLVVVGLYVLLFKIGECLVVCFLRVCWIVGGFKSGLRDWVVTFMVAAVGDFNLVLDLL